MWNVKAVNKVLEEHSAMGPTIGVREGTRTGCGTDGIPWVGGGGGERVVSLVNCTLHTCSR